MCNHLGRARDAACGDSPSPPAGDENPLPPGVRWTGYDDLPCLDAPVKTPLVFGGSSGSVAFPESGFLGYSPQKTPRAPLTIGCHISAP